MTPLRWICVLVVTSSACASNARIEIEPDLVSDKADGLPATLELRDDHRVGITEPSDLASHRGALYAVSDREARIYEIDGDGDVRRHIEIDIDGTDLEALAIDAQGSFYVGDEGRAKIWRIDDDGDRVETFEIDTTDGNSGIEGLAFDDGDAMLVAKEKHPATIISIDRHGDETNRETVEFADDLSALAWNRVDGHLYALSAEESKLWRLDRDFDRITSWRLPVEHPEGLAFAGTTVYVVSDTEERLYVFELD